MKKVILLEKYYITILADMHPLTSDSFMKASELFKNVIKQEEFL